MRQWLLLPVFLISALSLAAEDVPAWLIMPPQSSSDIYAAGISPRYLSDSLSFSRARQEAVTSLAKQIRVEVQTKFAEVERGPGIRSYGYTIETVDSTILRRCRGDARTVDSLLIDRYAFVLVSLPRDRKTRSSSDHSVSGAILSLDSLGITPDWTASPPQQPDIIYGVGISRPYRSMADAWTHSAREARREIAMSLSMKKALLATERINPKMSWYEEWSEDIADVTLEYATIQERWYDPVRKIYFTLVAYPHNQ